MGDSLNYFGQGRVHALSGECYRYLIFCKLWLKMPLTPSFRGVGDVYQVIDYQFLRNFLVNSVKSVFNL
jgi:hypothetical protein